MHVRGARRIAGAGRALAVVGLSAALYLATDPGRTGAQTVAPEITPARIEVEGVLAPGTRAVVTSIVVRNSGTVRLSSTLRAITDVDGEDGWIRFSPDAFELDPGEAIVADVAIDVPRDVALGPRRFRLRATVNEVADAPGVTLGVTAAVASLLVFEVGWPDVDAASAGMVTGMDMSGPPAWRFALVFAVAIVSGIVAWWLADYLGRFEFIVRRRPPPG
jgi:hypothetical protein